MKLFLALSIIILFISFEKTHSQQHHLHYEKLIDYSFIINGKSSSEFQTVGTGSIMNYKGQYYLITNFHVIAGKDHQTNKKFPHLKDTNVAVAIIFQNKDRKSKFIPIVYPIYDSEENELFETFMFKDQLIDISVMPVVVPENALKSFFTISDFDTSWSYKSDEKIFIFGFPKGEFKNEWQPAELKANSVSNSQRGPSIYDPYVFFDKLPIAGMSGSPVYFYDSNNKIKFLSVVSNIVDNNPRIKGRSIYSLCALQLIERMFENKKPSVVGKQYLQE